MTDSVLVKDLREVPMVAWPHWSSLRANSYHFIDPIGDRIVRVVLFERLGPGDTTAMSARYVPKHRNSYDVLYANLRLPLPGSGVDLVEPLGGTVTYRQESALTEAHTRVTAVAPVAGHVEVNIYIHTEGPSHAPMITLDQVAEVCAQLDRDEPGRLTRERGEYLADDGTVREALEVCWERWAGRPVRYPDPPRLDTGDDHDGLSFELNTYPWYPLPTAPGAWVKPFVGLNGDGPFVRLVKLEQGAQLHIRRSRGHRFLAVMAGRISQGGKIANDLTAMLSVPGSAFGGIRAEEPSLLWIVDWSAKGELDAIWEE